jgi:5-methylcytosine-specific restriction endonuclease McrA
MTSEKRLNILKRDKFICRVCGKHLGFSNQPQIAHRIKNSKMYLKLYGDEVINHPYNLVSTCSTRCNASVDIGYKSELVKELVEKIVKDIEKNKIKGV